MVMHKQGVITQHNVVMTTSGPVLCVFVWQHVCVHFPMELKPEQRASKNSVSKLGNRQWSNECTMHEITWTVLKACAILLVQLHSAPLKVQKAFKNCKCASVTKTCVTQVLCYEGHWFAEVTAPSCCTSMTVPLSIHLQQKLFLSRIISYPMTGAIVMTSLISHVTDFSDFNFTPEWCVFSFSFWKIQITTLYI